MFSKALENIIGSCYREARKNKYELMGVEQLLFFLLADEKVQDVIAKRGGDSLRLRSRLEAAILATAKILNESEYDDSKPTLGFQRVLQRAVYHIQSSGKGEVTPINCLVAIYGEKDTPAVALLEMERVNRLDVVNYISTGKVEDDEPSTAEKIERIRETPQIAPSVISTNQPKLRVFISYSHEDKCCLDRLLIHLRPLEYSQKIDAWSDKRIRPGDKWKMEIAEQIDQAAVAVLLLSADFLASRFIVEQELPPLLLAAESNGTRIIPVIVKPCGFHRDEILSSFQCVNDPKAPLLGLGMIDQEHLYESIASSIHEELRMRKLV